MIEIKNLTKKYGKHVAVDDLNMTVEDGKIYGLLGPNGAGKSTTMNIITGFIGATSGTVVINGHDIFKEPEEAKKCIGYLPEFPPLYADMTVYEYLKFAADLKKLDREKKKQFIYEAMELARITDVSGRLIKNLSKGYKQRVGLAQAVLGFPEVIILDEPTVGLDPKQIIEIREVIRQLAENHTIILSSHILSEVSELCDYIYIIANGKLIADDTTENIEKMTGASARIQISVKGSAEQTRYILETIDNIESFEITEREDEEGVTDALITLEDDTDIREELSFSFAGNRVAILSMELVTDSLEDVFIRLTTAADEEKAKIEAEQGAAGSVIGPDDDEAMPGEDDFSDVVDPEDEEPAEESAEEPADEIAQKPAQDTPDEEEVTE